MQYKLVCKRCNHLESQNGGKHYCKLSNEAITEITKHHCSDFEIASVSIFKYVLGDDGKFHRYYLSDEEALQLFGQK